MAGRRLDESVAEQLKPASEGSLDMTGRLERRVLDHRCHKRLCYGAEDLGCGHRKASPEVALGLHGDDPSLCPACRDVGNIQRGPYCSVSVPGRDWTVQGGCGATERQRDNFSAAHEAELVLSERALDFVFEATPHDANRLPDLIRRAGWVLCGGCGIPVDFVVRMLCGIGATGLGGNSVLLSCLASRTALARRDLSCRCRIGLFALGRSLGRCCQHRRVFVIVSGLLEVILAFEPFLGAAQRTHNTKGNEGMRRRVGVGDDHLGEHQGEDRDTIAHGRM